MLENPWRSDRTEKGVLYAGRMSMESTIMANDSRFHDFFDVKLISHA